MHDLFRRFAAQTSCVLGSPAAFVIAAACVAIWALSGPYFDYSDGWQLVINTSTTIAAFLMLFVLQSSQNRDTQTLNIKLDELLRAIGGARTGLTRLADYSDEELDRLEEELVSLGRRSPNQSVADDRDDAGQGRAKRRAPAPRKAPKKVPAG
jgi:low affinity Fe/Cu permease